MKLQPNDAVAAIILGANGRVLLQLRDDKPDIFFPNMWGLFGGAVEAGETPEIALLRELNEELGIAFPVTNLKKFTEFTFDFAPWGYGVLYRKFYLVEAAAYPVDRFVLGEGRKLGYFDLDDALATLKLVPYDAFALWMFHFSKAK
jgi:8-oxo-dGTP pyrophosphatase MutT (NUDIX family)